MWVTINEEGARRFLGGAECPALPGRAGLREEASRGHVSRSHLPKNLSSGA